MRLNEIVTEHYSDVIMSATASQITGVVIVYSTPCSGAHQRKHQSSASLAFVREIHWWPVNSPYKGPVTRKMFPFDDAIMSYYIQYIPRNMHTVFALLCFVGVIHWLIFPYPSGLLHWHCGNLTIAPVPAKQPWWIWINTSCEFIMNDCITTTKQSTTKACAYFLGYTVAQAALTTFPLRATSVFLPRSLHLEIDG